jgi:hypothetical protein
MGMWKKITVMMSASKKSQPLKSARQSEELISPVNSASNIERIFK